MTPEQMITQLIGTPYAPGGNTLDAVDCFGVVEIWYKHVLGIDVVDRAAHSPTHRGLMSGVEGIEDWEHTKHPENNCLVLMQSGKLKHGHVGVYHDGYVVHSDRINDACVCQRLNDKSIKPYVTGYLRRKCK